jgi:hypothetical protein
MRSIPALCLCDSMEMGDEDFSRGTTANCFGVISDGLLIDHVAVPEQRVTNLPPSLSE